MKNLKCLTLITDLLSGFSGQDIMTNPANCSSSSTFSLFNSLIPEWDRVPRSRHPKARTLAPRRDRVR